MTQAAVQRDRCPRCPVPLDPALAKAGLTMHPTCEDPPPAGKLRAVPDPPVITLAETCDIGGPAVKHDTPALAYPGEGNYCLRHATMMIHPARLSTWADMIAEAEAEAG